MLINLVQQKCLPRREAFGLVWERFYNISGKPDSNIEYDREMEYRIHQTKEFLGRLGSNFKPPYVQNITKTMDQFRSISKRMEEELKIRVQNSKHANPDRKKEVEALVNFLQDLKVFDVVRNRNTRRMNLPPSVFATIDKKKLEKWARDSIKELEKGTCFKRVNEERGFEEDEDEEEEEEEEEEDGGEEEEIDREELMEYFFNEGYGKVFGEGYADVTGEVASEVTGEMAGEGSGERFDIRIESEIEFEIESEVEFEIESEEYESFSGNEIDEEKEEKREEERRKEMQKQIEMEMDMELQMEREERRKDLEQRRKRSKMWVM